MVEHFVLTLYIVVFPNVLPHPNYLARPEVCEMWMQEPLYDLACIANAYNRDLTNWQHLYGRYHHMKIDRRVAALPFVRPLYSRKQSEDTKLKISSQ